MASASSSAAAAPEPADPAQDLCRVTVVSDSCARERSCTECLAAEVPAQPDGCYLDASAGVCRAFSQLVLSPRTSTELNSSTTPATKWQALEAAGVFASLGARAYCDRLDSACALCARAANSPETFTPTAAELATMSADRRVCFGTGGCVCVAACESVERMSYTSKRCPGETEPAASAVQSERTGFPSAQMFALLIVTAFLLVRCVSECFRVRVARQRAAGLRDTSNEADASGVASNQQSASQRRHRQQQRRQPRQRQRSDLQLTGWIAWHRELREMERRGELGYVELNTPEGDESGLRTAADSATSASMLMVTWAPRNAI